MRSCVLFHSHHGDCGPSLRCVNLVQSCQNRSVFLCVMGGNNKGAFSCTVELKGLKSPKALVKPIDTYLMILNDFLEEGSFLCFQI